MATLNIGGSITAGRDINIAQEGSQISNKYNDIIHEELNKYKELTDIVQVTQTQIQELLNNSINPAYNSNTSTVEESSFLNNLKKIGTKSLDLATAIIGNALQNVIQKYI